MNNPTQISNSPPPSLLDIEHIPVENDPRAWSPLRKNASLVLIASASMIAGLAGSIQNPAVRQMQEQLHATPSQFSLSIAVFILVHGLVPLVWSAVSEIRGRKALYIVSLALFTLGAVGAALVKTIQLVIAFRAVQAAGSSAVITVGAATLADIFDPHERGTKMGIYYMAPLLGPSLGPVLGGVLTTGFNWRAIFWFLAIVSGMATLSFLLFFTDTFRPERSLTYQTILRRKIRQASAASTRRNSVDDSHKDASQAPSHGVDLEKAETYSTRTKVDEPVIQLSLKDVNPFIPIAQIMRRWNNLVILIGSGLLFAFGHLVAYATARTLSSHYGYDPLETGIVLLSYGLGCIAGSVLGGYWSDKILKRLKAENGGVSYPEASRVMRLKSVTYTALIFPLFTVGYGWLCQQRVHISGICVMLFACGFLSIWTYASTLAYVVDANAGRSSTAVAANNAFRGISAFIATEVAVPLQDGLGDGWTWTIWGFLMLLSGLLTILVARKGAGWRKTAEEREAAAAAEGDD